MSSYLEDERKVYSVLKADENTYAIDELEREARMLEEKVLYVLSRLIEKGKVVREQEEHLVPEKHTIDIYRVSKRTHITKGRIPFVKHPDIRCLRRMGPTMKKQIEDFERILEKSSEVSPEAWFKEFTI